MIKCSNCGKELADGSKFCDTCGMKLEAVPAPQSEPTVAEIPVSEPAVSEDSDFEPTVTEPAFEAPAYDSMVNEAPVPEKKKSNKMLGVLIGIIAGVAALILIIVLVVAFSGNSGHNYALYYKNGEVNYTDLPSAKPFEVSDKDGTSAKLSANGKYIVYINDSEDDRTLSIRRADRPKKEALEIKNDVSTFLISDNSKYVIFLADGNLYEYNISKDNAVKIKNDVEEFELYEDSKKIIYYVEGEDEEVFDYYIRTMGKEDDQKIASDATDLNFVDNKCKEFYYVSDDTLYFAKVGKEAKEIDDDLSASLTAVFEDGSVYYKKYEDAHTVTLCYYSGKGDPVEIFDEVANISTENYAIEKPVAVFTVTEDWDDDSIAYIVSYGNISEIEHDDAQTFRITEDGSALYYLADINYEGGSKSATSEGADETTDSYGYSYDDYDYDYDDYGYDEGEFENATLYLAKIGKKGITKTTEYDTEVYEELHLIDNKTVVYFKDYDLDDENGTLYVNKKEIDTEVEVIHYLNTDTKTFMYAKDMKDSTVTLYLCKNGKKSVKIDDDVYNASFTGKGDVIYLKDYDSDDYEGDLLVFTGRKSKDVDTEVSSFVVDYTANTYF